VFVNASPVPLHQRALRDLFVILYDHVAAHDLGEVLFAPIAVVLDRISVVEPDLVFIARARRAIVEHKGVFGAPDLLVEVLSPSTAARDRGRKKDLYARSGVACYWLLDPRAGRLVAWRLTDDAYGLEADVGPRGTFKPALFPGLSIALRHVLRN
jgi:Uma2 family endonuclease